MIGHWINMYFTIKDLTACSSLSNKSISSSIRNKSILQKTLLAMDKRVIPLELSQLLKSPFLGSFVITPLHQSSGIVSSIQIARNRSDKYLVEVSKSAFKISAWIRSIPGDLLDFKDSIALLTSASVGASTFISKSLSALSGSAMVSGSGLFRTSLKCSTHLSAFSRSVVSIWPCLFLSVLEDAGFFPARSLVIL